MNIFPLPIQYEILVMKHSVGVRSGAESQTLVFLLMERLLFDKPFFWNDSTLEWQLDCPLVQA